MLPLKTNEFSHFAFYYTADPTVYFHSTSQKEKEKKKREANDMNRGEMHRWMVTGTSPPQLMYKAHC